MLPQLKNTKAEGYLLERIQPGANKSQFGVERPSLHCPVSSKKDMPYPKEWKWGMSQGRKPLEDFSPKKEAPVGVCSKFTREAVHYVSFKASEQLAFLRLE